MTESINIYDKYNINLSRLSRDYIKFPLKRKSESNLSNLIEYPIKEDMEYLYLELNLPISLISKIFCWNSNTLTKIIKKIYKLEKSKPLICKSRTLSKDLRNPNWKEYMIEKSFASKERNNPNWKQDMVEKVKNTKLLRYRNKNFNNTLKNQQTRERNNTLQNNINILKKREQNYKIKTGYEYNSQIQEVKEQKRKTCKLKYNCDNAKQIHINHFEDLNEDFFRNNFITNNKFLIHKCVDYFNLSMVTINVYKSKFNIIEPNLSQICYRQNLWLDQLNIMNRKFVIKHKNKRYKPDGYDPKTNTIYEFLGDFWHGNPEIYNLDDINIKCDKTFKKLNEYTFQRFDEIKSLGYKIIYIWENDFIKNNKINEDWREKMHEY